MATRNSMAKYISAHLYGPALPNFMGLSPSSEVASRGAAQVYPQHFMAPEGSLPYSQEPSTGSYPKPDQYRPHHLILSL
jgi:hypothetical protein